MNASVKYNSVNDDKASKYSISITDKYKALQKISQGKSTNKSNTEEYGVKKNTVSTWIANKRKITEAYESGQVNSSRKKMKKSTRVVMEIKCCYLYFTALFFLII